jgi:hypothetical protein
MRCPAIEFDYSVLTHARETNHALGSFPGAAGCDGFQSYNAPRRTSGSRVDTCQSSSPSPRCYSALLAPRFQLLAPKLIAAYCLLHTYLSPLTFRLAPIVPTGDRLSKDRTRRV